MVKFKKKKTPDIKYLIEPIILALTQVADSRKSVLIQIINLYVFIIIIIIIFYELAGSAATVFATRFVTPIRRYTRHGGRILLLLFHT